MIVTKSAVTLFKNGIKLSLTEKLNLPSSWFILTSHNMTLSGSMSDLSVLCAIVEIGNLIKLTLK